MASQQASSLLSLVRENTPWAMRQLRMRSADWKISRCESDTELKDTSATSGLDLCGNLEFSDGDGWQFCEQGYGLQNGRIPKRLSSRKVEEAQRIGESPAGRGEASQAETE